MADAFGWLTLNRDVLTWLGGGLATAAGGAWVVVRYLLERGRDKSPSDKAADSSASSGPSVSTGTGISAAGDMRVEGNVSIQQNSLPKAAIILAALGLALLGYAFYSKSSQVVVKNGSYIGGSAINSPVTVGPSKAKGD